jgi:hypothetical protein
MSLTKVVSFLLISYGYIVNITPYYRKRSTAGSKRIMVELSGLNLLNEVRDERLARVRGSVKTISKQFSEESLELTGYISAQLSIRK